MRPDTQLYSPEFLNESFTLSSLWSFREDLINVRDSVFGLMEQALLLHDLNKALTYEKQLIFIDQNIDRIEFTMLMKESEIFEYWEYCEICLN